MIKRIVTLSGSVAAIRICRRAAKLHPNRRIVTDKDPMSMALTPNVLGGVFSNVRHPLRSVTRSSYNTFVAHNIDISSLSHAGG